MMKNEDWIKYHTHLARKGFASARHNGFEFEASTEAYRQIIRETILRHCNGVLLDVCCGSGDVTAPLTDTLSVTGVEAVSRSCELAESRGLIVENTLLGDFHSKRKFDMVVCVEAITLLDEPNDLLDLYRRVRSKKSSLLVSFVNRQSILRKLYNFCLKRKKSTSSVDKFSFMDVQMLASQHSLSVVEYHYILQYVFGAFTLPKFLPSIILRALSTHITIVFDDD